MSFLAVFSIVSVSSGTLEATFGGLISVFLTCIDIKNFFNFLSMIFLFVSMIIGVKFCFQREKKQIKVKKRVWYENWYDFHMSRVLFTMFSSF